MRIGIILHGASFIFIMLFATADSLSKRSELAKENQKAVAINVKFQTACLASYT
jgi:hypothetical protein